MWKKVKIFLVPVLFAIYPVLALYAHNIEVLGFDKILRLLLFSIFLGAAATGILLLVVRDRLKASLIAITCLIVFFSYGHLYNLVHDTWGANIGRNVFLLPLALLVMIGTGVLIWKRVRNPARLFSFFGYMITILLLMVSYSVAKHFGTVNLIRSTSLGISQTSATTGTGEKPDIYYIILDGHGRQDILQGLYGYDDTEFIQFLESRGFYVATSSHSNYAQTQLSLSSSLNLDYLDSIGLPADPAQWSRDLLFDRIKHSLVRQILSEKGYQTVAFSNSFPTAITDADVFFDYKVSNLREVELLFFSSTMMRIAVEHGWLMGIDNQQQARHHYEEVEYAFENLADVPALPGDYFIFAHIIAPHPPFVFDPAGGFVYNPFSYGLEDGSQFKGTVDEYVTNYRAEVISIDHTMEGLIDTILSSSSTPPIIIIQSDHGPGAHLNWESIDRTNLDERMSILNAYYFPGVNDSGLYASITPVNSFRILLNEYFGAAYGLLEDRSYFSGWSHPFDFIDVSDRLAR